MTVRLSLAVAMTLLLSPAATAQSPEQMLAEDMARNDAQVRAVVGQIMQDPQVQAAYQQHLAQGGGGSFYDYALWWGRTVGGTRSQHWEQTQRDISRRQQLEQQQYQAWQRGQQQQTQHQRGWSHDSRSNAVGGVLQGMHIERHGQGCWMVPHVAGAPAAYPTPCPPWL